MQRTKFGRSDPVKNVPEIEDLVTISKVEAKRGDKSQETEPIAKRLEESSVNRLVRIGRSRELERRLKLIS